MKLSDAQIGCLVWVFHASILTWGATATVGHIHQGTLKALIRRGLVQCNPTNHRYAVTTPEGEKLVLEHYHHKVVDMQVKMFGWSKPPLVVEDTLKRLPLKHLPIYLTHEHRGVRALAKEVMKQRCN